VPRSKRPDPSALFDAPAARPRGRGRHERRVDVAIRAASDDGILEDTHGGIVAALRALGRSLDSAEAEDSPYAVVTVTRELRAVLDVARMLPAPSTVADPFAALLDDLSTDDATRT